MAVQDNETTLEKNDAKETTGRSLKRKLVLRRLRYVGILLAAFSILLLIVTSMQEKKDLGKRIDHWFEVRDSKFSAYLQTRLDVLGDLDEADSDEVIKKINYIQALDQLMMSRHNQSSEVSPLSLSGRAYQIETSEISYVDHYEENEEGYLNTHMAKEDVSVIMDADGDEICLTPTGIYTLRHGFVYGKTLVSMGSYNGDNSDYYFSFEAENYESRKDEEMKEAAEDLFNKGKASGWYKDYRYNCFYYEYPDEEREEFHIPDDEKYGSIQFYDASSELKEIRNHTVNRALWLFGGDVLILLVLFVLFSMEKAPVAESISDSAFAKKEKKEKGLSEELSKRLLDYIEQSERSYGPNGYLDEMRTLLEGESEDPEGTDTSDV